MLKKNSGFALPLFLVLMMTLTAMVVSIVCLTTASVKDIGLRAEKKKARYISEAGIYKAIWYLTTPVAEGGKGMTWRTEGFSEEFAEGSYTISVKDEGTEDLFIISSRGSYKNTERETAVLAGETFAGSFVDFALHSDRGIGIDAAANIAGDVYADGTVTVEAGAQVTDGTVSVTEGNDVTGEGSYVEGTAAVEDPPVIDYDFYAEKIAIAAGGGPGVVAGDRVVTYYDLNGHSVYVNGNVTIEGVIAGNGEIIAAQSIDIRNAARFTGRLRIIAGDKMRVFAGANFEKAAMLYAENLILIRPNFQNPSLMAALTPSKLTIGGGAKMKGIFFGGKITIGENSVLAGNVIGGATEGVLEVGPGVRLVYRDFTGKVPAGFNTTVKIYKWL
jgi:hypothetical protein